MIKRLFDLYIKLLKWLFVNKWGRIVLALCLLNILYTVIFFDEPIKSETGPGNKSVNELQVKNVTVQAQKIVYNKDSASLVKSFGYSLQAGLICDNLKMRLDTEDTVAKKIKTSVRDGIYKDDYLIGIDLALKDDITKTLCSTAWKAFGCYGDVEPKLLQQVRPNFIQCIYK